MKYLKFCGLGKGSTQHHIFKSNLNLGVAIGVGNGYSITCYRIGNTFQIKLVTKSSKLFVAGVPF